MIEQYYLFIIPYLVCSCLTHGESNMMNESMGKEDKKEDKKGYRKRGRFSRVRTREASHFKSYLLS